MHLNIEHLNTIQALVWQPKEIGSNKLGLARTAKNNLMGQIGNTHIDIGPQHSIVQFDLTASLNIILGVVCSLIILR